MAGRDKTKVSAARRRAEEHTSGFQTTLLNIPEGVGFYDFKVGTHLVDVVPYIVKKGKETPGGNPYAFKGELYYERTFHAYRRIGPEEKDYVCPSKTFGETDYVQEYRQQKSRDPEVKPESLKALDPKERQIYLFYSPKEPQKKIQIIDLSFHLFGKLLDSRIQNSTEEEGWDLFYYPDMDGMTLRITVEEISQGGYKWNEATAIDFIPRKEPLPESIVNHGLDLDSMLRRFEYEELKSVFLGVKPKKDSVGSDKKEDSATNKDRIEEDDVPFEKGKETSKDASPSSASKESKSSAARHCALEKGMEIKWKDRRCRITRVSDDKTTVTLLDEENDDVFKNISADEVILFADTKENFERSKTEEKKPTKQTATELGFKKDDAVVFKGLTCAIARISEDGYQVTLIDSEDNVHKNVDVDQIKKEDKKPEKAEEPKKDSPKQEKKDTKKESEGSDEEWDSTWAKK